MNYQEIAELASDKSNDLTDIFNDLLDEIEDSPHETTKDLYICSNTIYDIMEICKTNGYTLVLERVSILLDKY